MRINTFLSLVKVELYQLFTSMVASRNRKTKAQWLMLLTFLLPALLSIYVTGVYTLILVQYLSIEYRYLILVMGAVIATVLVFVLTFYHASGHLFDFKDYDLLMSMPIPNSAILISKLLSFYLYNYFFTVFLMIAPVYGYTKMGPTSLLFYLYALLGSIFLPLVPLILSSMIAFVITYAASRNKYRNRMITLLSFAIVLIIMLGSFQVNQFLMVLNARVDEIMPALSKYYPPVYYYVVSMDRLSLYHLLLLAGRMLLSGIVFVLLFARCFKWLNNKIRITKTSSRKRYSDKKIMQNSIFKSLLRREISRYLNSQSYLLNTMIGPVMALIGTILMIINDPQEIEVLLELPSFAENIMPMLVAMVCFMAVVSVTTASSISMEGKNFWILKSIPVDENMIFTSKITLNLLVLIPVLSLLAIILSIRFTFSIIDVALLLGFITIASIFTSTLGLIMNLHFPKLDWINEVTVVKQSLSVILSMALGAAVFGILIFLYIKVGINYSRNLVLGVYLLILLVLVVGLWRYLQTKGRALFKAM